MGDGNKNIKVCYNSAKSSQLGWYSENEKVIDVASGEGFTGRVVGLTDFGSVRGNSAQYTVILKVTRSKGSNFYIAYNRREGMNADTREAGNQVTVTAARDGQQSWLLAKMDVGDSREFVNFDTGLDLVVNVTSSGTSGDIDFVNVEVETRASAPTTTPTSVPTTTPTSVPTTTPTPTMSPTDLPRGDARLDVVSMATLGGVGVAGVALVGAAMLKRRGRNALQGKHGFGTDVTTSPQQMAIANPRFGTIAGIDL
jgi:hypothetical protein